ncbi:hypothetical protein EXU57_15770 [Segetibacter sp. 3557_3]|uniref:hypothetical protein n=1 Tax=Segetibacter sp. 3557_3 TaxID=2547429 RepID=UPI00105847B1|nr:hypothetical protein [Segetibacter sp. 3557_3]TDH23951.1 hypothetical protein EXU57_15770 [Segetibacter sp. 3557_3]
MSLVEKPQYKDGIVLRNEQNPEEFITVNQLTLIEVIKGIMVKYANKELKEAESIIELDEFLSEKINSFNKAIQIAHEHEYHWAMLLIYGDLYWHKGVSEILPADYREWNRKYRRENGLAKSSFEYA